MKYVLKHKNIDVLKLKFSYDGSIEKIYETYNIEHLPIGSIKKGIIDKNYLNMWWKNRLIPKGRPGIEHVLFLLNLNTTSDLSLKSYGLNLSDHYWIKPESEQRTWNDINFFKNGFKNNISDLLFEKVDTFDNDAANFFSPDCSSNGLLKKKWIIENNKHYLLKAGSGINKEEPFNEVIACKLMQKLNIPHITYELTKENDVFYSKCENFVTENTELIAAYNIYNYLPKNNNASKYEHFILCSKQLGLSAIEDFLDKMLTLDFLIANEDRHWGNFGLIRDADTLEIKGMAPIYDNGSSLFYSTPTIKIEHLQDIQCKPFYSLHSKQISLIKSFDWLKIKNTDNIVDEYNDLLKLNENVDDKRRGALCHAFKNRFTLLERHIELNRDHNIEY